MVPQKIIIVGSSLHRPVHGRGLSQPGAKNLLSTCVPRKHVGRRPEYTRILAGEERKDDFDHQEEISLGVGDGIVGKCQSLVQQVNERAPRAPWGVDTILTVMILWIISFWISAYSLVPSILSYLKNDLQYNLSYSGTAAMRHLLLDVSQIFSIAILLRRSLREYKPLDDGFFRISFRDKTSWIITGLGILAFPCVDWVHRHMVSLLTHGARNASGAIHDVSSGSNMFVGDGLFTKVSWFLVLGLVAPVWEEVMFRGFLLPSVTRLSSPTVGVFLTSLIFSLVHFTKEGFVPLMILGAIFGVSYCATSNLLPAIVLHGVWNICLLLQLL
jgi:membrane protease YdiL (CAAX protease family)